MPQSRALRIALGCLFVIGGILGFLPVLGFWMIPLGLFILSHDLPTVRRWRRRLVLRFSKRREKA
ncbi:MAG: PGPGW domain-containing protein [Pseudomonadota bacterium]